MAATNFSGPVVSTNGFKTGSTTLTGADFASIQSLVSGAGIPQSRAVVLGDSLVSNGLVSSATTAIYTARAIAQLGAARLGQRIQIVGHDGVSGTLMAGSGATTFYSRIDALLATYRPAWVLMIGGSNDIDADSTADQVMSSDTGIAGILAKCQAAGAALVFFDTSAGGYGSDARFSAWFDVHRRCVDLHRQQVGFSYFPMYPGAVDYSTTNNARYCVAAASMLYDSRHPTAYGVHTVYSNAVADFFTSAGLPAWQPGVGGGRTGLSGAIGDQHALLKNGMFAAAGGTVGAGNTGSMPNDFDAARTGSITAAFSTLARTDRSPGMWLVAALSAAAAAADFVTVSGTATNNAGFLTQARGKTCWLEIDVDATASSGTLGQLEAQIQILNSSFALLFTAAVNRIVGVEYLGVTAFKGRLRTPSFTMPATADRGSLVLKMGTSVGGVASVKWAAPELHYDI